MVQTGFQGSQMLAIDKEYNYLKKAVPKTKTMLTSLTPIYLTYYEVVSTNYSN